MECSGIMRPDLDFNIDFSALAQDTVSTYNHRVLSGVQGHPVYKSISEVRCIRLYVVVHKGFLAMQSQYETDRKTISHSFIGPELAVTHTPDGKKIYELCDLSDKAFDFAALASSIEKEYDNAKEWTPPIQLLTVTDLDHLSPQECQQWGFRHPESLLFPGPEVAAKQVSVNSWLLSLFLGDGNRQVGTISIAHQEEPLQKMLTIAQKMGGDLIYCGGLMYGIHKVRQVQSLGAVHPIIADDLASATRIIYNVDKHLLAHAASASTTIRASPVPNRKNVWHLRESALVYKLTCVSSEEEAHLMVEDIKDSLKAEKVLKTLQMGEQSKNNNDDSASDLNNTLDNSQSDLDSITSPATASHGKNLLSPKLKDLQVLTISCKKGSAVDRKHIPMMWFGASSCEKHAEENPV
ncbi:hypothetical protein JCM1840_005605 [Sporobolomyces johnsonii]